MKQQKLRDMCRGMVTRKNLFILVFLLFCSAIIFLQLRHGDYYFVSKLQDRLSPTDALTTYLEENPRFTGNDVATGQTTFSGERYHSDEFVLFDALYHLTINYTYEGEGAQAELLLRDLNGLSEDNTASTVLFRQALAPGVNQQIVVPLRMPTTHAAVKAVLTAPGNGALVVNTLALQTVRPYFSDSFLIVLFVLLCAGALWWLCTRARDTDPRSRRITTVCICFFMACAAFLPFLQQGVPFGHDTGYHLTRIEGMQQSLASGQLFAHLNPAVFRGFGSVEFIYYPNLMLYVPAVLRLLHVSLLLSYKALFFMIQFVTVLCAYKCAVTFYPSRKAALIFASIYTFALYRMMNVYTRGAVGELFAMAFLPLVLLGLHSIFWTNKKRWGILAIGMFGVLSSHVISVVLVGFLLVLYCIVLWKKLLQRDIFFSCCKAAALTLCLSMTWLLPFLLWLQYPTNATLHTPTDITESAAQPAQMLSTFAFSAIGKSLPQAKGIAGEMPLSLGIVLGIGILLYLLVRYYWRDPAFSQNEALHVLGTTCLVGAAVCLFAATPLFPYFILSKFGKLNFLSRIQFPWRFLGPATLFSAVLTALALILLLRRVRPTAKPLAAVFVVLLPFLLCLPYLDSYTATAANGFSSNNDMPINIEGDFMYFPQAEVQRPFMFPVIACDDADFAISACGREPLKVWFSFSNSSGAPQTIRVPLYGFSITRATLNDSTQLPVETGPWMEALVQLPQGHNSGTITAQLVLPWYFYVGDAISLFTGIGVLVYLFRKKHHHKEHSC